DLLALNPDDQAPARLDRDLAAGLLPPGELSPRDGAPADGILAPAGHARYLLSPAPPICAAPRMAAPARAEGAPQARIAIEQVAPAVDG
ncbi:hypothetical protein SB751_31305, partial [Cupriavidus sp. SIMBA_020]